MARDVSVIVFICLCLEVVYGQFGFFSNHREREERRYGSPFSSVQNILPGTKRIRNRLMGLLHVRPEEPNSNPAYVYSYDNTPGISNDAYHDPYGRPPYHHQGNQNYGNQYYNGMPVRFPSPYLEGPYDYNNEPIVVTDYTDEGVNYNPYVPNPVSFPENNGPKNEQDLSNGNNDLAVTIRSDETTTLPRTTPVPESESKPEFPLFKPGPDSEPKPGFPSFNPGPVSEPKPEFPHFNPVPESESKPEFPPFNPGPVLEPKPEFPPTEPSPESESKPELPSFKPGPDSEPKPEFPQFNPVPELQSKPEFPPFNPGPVSEPKPEFPLYKPGPDSKPKPEFPPYNPGSESDSKPEFPPFNPSPESKPKPEFPPFKPGLDSERKPEFPPFNPVPESESKPEFPPFNPGLVTEPKPEFPPFKPSPESEPKPEFPPFNPDSVPKELPPLKPVSPLESKTDLPPFTSPSEPGLPLITPVPTSKPELEIPLFKPAPDSESKGLPPLTPVPPFKPGSESESRQLPPLTPVPPTDSRNNVNFGSQELFHETCNTVEGNIGSCISVFECEPYLALLQQSRTNPALVQVLRKAHCGFEGNNPKVCCPRPGIPTSPPTAPTTTTTPAPAEAKSIPEDDFVTALPEPPVCGVSNASFSRVVGGIDAQLGDFPWMALLGYMNKRLQTTKWLCGGALVTSKHVLTAAHCIHGHEIDLHVVRLGELDLAREDDGATPIDVLVKTKIKHEEYSANAYTNDIGIIVLQRHVQFTDLIRPICIPRDSELRARSFENYNPLIAGWGDIEFRGPSATHLQVLQLPVVSNDFCAQAYSAYKAQTIDERVLCAGYKKGGKDACQGDSGGPLMQPIWNSKTYVTYFYQIGVVSYGKKCAEAGFPGVYTRVTQFVPWIERTILGAA